MLTETKSTETPTLADHGNKHPDDVGYSDLKPYAFKNLGKVDIKPRQLTTESQARRLSILRELTWSLGVELHLVELDWKEEPENQSEIRNSIVAYDGDRKILFLDYRFSKKVASSIGYRHSQSKKGDWSRYDCKFAISMSRPLAIGIASIRAAWPPEAKERKQAPHVIYQQLVEKVSGQI